VALALILNPGCGGDRADEKSEPGNSITISFLTMQLRPAFDSFFLPLFQEYENTHPGVKIEWLDYPYQNYETKIMTSFMAGNSPDVINLGSESVPSFAQGGMLVQVDDLLSSRVIDSYLPNILEQGCGANGRLYAVPWYLAGSATFYNKAIFEEAGLSLDPLPTSYGQLPPLMKAVREKTGKFGYFPLYTESGALRGYLLEAGVPLLDKSGTRAAFNTPRGVEILKFWTDLYKENLVPSEALTAMHRRPIELFNTSKLAILETGPQFLRQIKSDAPEVYEQTVVGPDLGWPEMNLHVLVLQALSISSQSKNPTEAAEFAAFVTNAKNQLAFCKEVVILPSATAALDDPYFTQPEDTPEGLARLYSAQIARTGVIPPVPRNSKKLFKVFDDVTEAVALGNMTAEEGLAKAETEWNRILSED